MAMETSKLAKILSYKKPIELFQQLLKNINDPKIVMNLATIDSEFGPLNRTVVYRGIVDENCIIFVTERNTRKYANLKENPKISVTFFFDAVPPFEDTSAGDVNNIWQVRLFDAIAEELDESHLTRLWSEEPLFARLRSNFCQCGVPVGYDEHKQRHDQLLAECGNDGGKVERTPTYTAFKIIAKRWDFYKSGEQQVGDRLQFRRPVNMTGDGGDEWEVMHVAA